LSNPQNSTEKSWMAILDELAQIQDRAFLGYFDLFAKHKTKKMAEVEDQEIAAARARMIARRFGGQSAATGGKGTVRRKHKAVHKTASSDDKKLGSTLKKLGVTNIPAIEEVNLFTSDSNVIHFSNPKVQASIAANTYVVSGPNETKSIAEMIPGILPQVRCWHKKTYCYVPYIFQESM
jgi:hypothetical protein